MSHVRMALEELNNRAKGGPVPRMRATIELGPSAMGSGEGVSTRVVKREGVMPECRGGASQPVARRREDHWYLLERPIDDWNSPRSGMGNSVVETG